MAIRDGHPMMSTTTIGIQASLFTTITIIARLRPRRLLAIIGTGTMIGTGLAMAIAGRLVGVGVGVPAVRTSVSMSVFGGRKP